MVNVHICQMLGISDIADQDRVQVMFSISMGRENEFFLRQKATQQIWLFLMLSKSL